MQVTAKLPLRPTIAPAIMQPEQLQMLFDELSAALVLYARGWCELPDDAVQEAFIDLANCGVLPESPKAWLYQTTRRKAQNIARSEGRRQRHQRRAVEEGRQWFEAAKPSSDLAPADVARALERLGREDRELVVARIWGGLGFEQLAELAGCSTSSAHRRYAAALKRLKTMVIAQDMTAADRASETGSDRKTGYVNIQCRLADPPTPGHGYGNRFDAGSRTIEEESP